MAAPSRRPKKFLTASQIARFCQVDLKTIHNWADRGRISHFRTPGRHLRFRRPQVLDFLRKYGYPIPEELTPERPRVALLLDATGSKAVVDALQDTFDVLHCADAVDGLLKIGAQPPDAVVLGPSVGRLSGVEIIAALKRKPRTQHVRAVFFSSTDGDRREALQAGASAHVNASDLQGLKDTLEALMGLRR